MARDRLAVHQQGGMPELNEKHRHIMSADTSTPRLSIAIPTYNRASLLKLCLESILEQSDPDSDEIEILISDNASTDNTPEVIESFIHRRPSIRDLRNERNFGPDYNLKNCYDAANGTYVWIFSDDDLLLPNAIPRLMPLLRNRNLGLITIVPQYYRDTIDLTLYPEDEFEWQEFNDPLKHASRTHFLLTYISATIVNKASIRGNDLAHPGMDSFLGQLSWIYPALFGGLPSAEIRSSLMLGRSLAVMDYKHFHVFGTSYRKVLDFLHAEGKLPLAAKEKLLDLIITDYFHPYLKDPTYRPPYGERPLKVLLAAFWDRPAFWNTLVPVVLWRNSLFVTEPLSKVVHRLSRIRLIRARRFLRRLLERQ